MADTLLRNIALVAESDIIGDGDLNKVSAALQKQVARDLSQFWQVHATVDVFERLEDIPIGYWPIIVMDNIGYDAAGIHLDDNNQPFALVTASHDLDEWSLTTSHELIEMLLDPYGNRLVTGDSPKEDQKRVQFLLEACDPPEAAEFAYTVNGILVSDFYSVRFFDPVAVQGVRYSFTGAIQAPRQVLKGGYLSWLDIESNEWWQETWFGGSKPVFRSLGQINARAGSFRSQIDRLTFSETAKAVSGGIGVARAAGLAAAAVEPVVSHRADRLRAQIHEIVGASAYGARAAEAEISPSGIIKRKLARGGARAGDGQAPVGLRVAPSVSSNRGITH